MTRDILCDIHVVFMHHPPICFSMFVHYQSLSSIICFSELADAATLEAVAKDLTIMSIGIGVWAQFDPIASRQFQWISSEIMDDSRVKCFDESCQVDSCSSLASHPAGRQKNGKRL